MKTDHRSAFYWKFQMPCGTSGTAGNKLESRRSWLMWLFKPKVGITFWQPDNHSKETNSRDFFMQKMQYIHQNPVRAGLVDREEAWMYSSARDFYNMKGLLKLSYFD